MKEIRILILIFIDLLYLTINQQLIYPMVLMWAKPLHDDMALSLATSKTLVQLAHI